MLNKMLSLWSLVSAVFFLLLFFGKIKIPGDDDNRTRKIKIYSGVGFISCLVMTVIWFFK